VASEYENIWKGAKFTDVFRHSIYSLLIQVEDASGAVQAKEKKFLVLT
jgi:hypothetical protein